MWITWSLLYFDVCMRACARVFVCLLYAVVSPPPSSPPLPTHVHPVISFENLHNETDYLGTFLTVYSELESASAAESHTTLSDCDIEAQIEISRR